MIVNGAKEVVVAGSRRCGWVDDSFYLADRINGKGSAQPVLANKFGAGRDINTVGFVVHDIALHPLDLGTELADNAARPGGKSTQLLGAEFSDAWNRSFDDIFWHISGLSVFVNT